MSDASNWDEGGTNRIALHVAGGALLGGLGGGSIGTALQGASGAGLSAAMAKQLDDIYKGVGSATGSELLGNLAANVVAGVGGALVGGAVGAATASNVELYNQSMYRKKNDLVAQACPATGQCNEAVLNAAIQAQGDNAAVASENVKTAAIYGTAAAAVAAGVVLAPEVVAGIASIPGAPIFSRSAGRAEAYRFVPAEMNSREVATMQSFDDLMRHFIDALISLYPDKEACIRQMASEDTGPALDDYDVYGERVDTGARVNGYPIWRYMGNDVHVCETEAGGVTLFRWVEHDPEPCL